MSTVTFTDTMAERLIIQNFAGLNIDIELGRINIFIGPQASGKSVCVKCAEFFKHFVPELISRAVSGIDEKTFQEHVIINFSRYFNLKELSKKFVIRYNNGENFIELKKDKSKVTVSYSIYYNYLFDQVSNVTRNIPSHNISESISFEEDIKSRFRAEADKQLGKFNASWCVFVPATRALYSIAGTEETVVSDIFLDQFRTIYARLMRIDWQLMLPKNSSIVTELAARILNATPSFRQDGELYLQQNNGIKTALVNSSSGQQEVLPLIVFLQYLAWADIREGYVALIEEPEAHLHPTAQNDLVSLIASVFNTSRTPCQLFITTHTPYLLSSFNNLIYAGQLASKLKKNDSAGRKKLYAAVPKELHLNLADFRVYGLEDGKATLLIDDEFGLLMAHSLDNVSDIIADQFGDLMALDPANKPSAAN